MPVDFETLYVGTWTQRLMVADSYGCGRVFLAGDSAHLVIPTGGLGMNTGVGDAMDLSWKLAATLRGWGGPGLLASYEHERRSTGLRNVNASRRPLAGRRKWRGAWRPEIVEDSPRGEPVRAELAELAEQEQRYSNDLLGIELGYRYDDSPIVMPEAGTPPDLDSFVYTPTTWPGARIPLVWFADGVGVQDRIGMTNAFTLLRLGAARPEVRALAEAFARRGAPFDVLDLDGADVRDVYERDLVLVRPDLHVGWRGEELPGDVDELVDVVTGHRVERV